jgi:hypothetical protein
MRSLLGLLLILSGVLLAVPQVYDALAPLDINRWPVVQGILGLACISIGTYTLIRGGKKVEKKVWTEVS